MLALLSLDRVSILTDPNAAPVALVLRNEVLEYAYIVSPCSGIPSNLLLLSTTTCSLCAEYGMHHELVTMQLGVLLLLLLLGDASCI